MRSVLISNIKQSLLNRDFFIGLWGMVLAIGLSSLEITIKAVRNAELFSNGFHAQLIVSALSSDWVVLTLLILCTMPFTASFVDDVKSGFIKLYICRSGVVPYIKAKLLACGLSGGLTLFSGIMIAYGLSTLLLSPLEAPHVEGQFVQPYLAQVLLKAAMVFFSGVFWSITGAALAALTMSKYVAYASPFILYYVLIILKERYFDNLYVLYPKEWISPSDGWIMGKLGVILLLVELVAIVSLVFAITAKRRLENV